MVDEKKVVHEQAKEEEEDDQDQDHEPEQDHYKGRSRSRTTTPQLDSSAGRLLVVEVAATIKFFISKFSFVRTSFCFHTSSLSCNYGMQNDVRDGVRTVRGSSASSEHDSRMSPRSLLLHALQTAEPLPSTVTSTVTNRSGSSSGLASNSRKSRKVSYSLLISTSTFLQPYVYSVTHSAIFILIPPSLSLSHPRLFFFLLSQLFLSLPFSHVTTLVNMTLSRCCVRNLCGSWS